MNMSPDEIAAIMRCSGCGRRPEELEDYLVDTVTAFAPEPPSDLPPARHGEFILAHWRDTPDVERTAAVRRWAVNRERTLNVMTGAFACITCWVIGGMPDGTGLWTVPDGAEWPKLREDFLLRAAFLRMRVPKNSEDK